MPKQWQVKIGITLAIVIAVYVAYKRKLGPFGSPEIQELFGKKPAEAPSVPQLVQGGDVPSPNQFQGPSAAIGTGSLTGPQVKPDENVRQTFLREMYKQVYLPFSEYPFMYDNPTYLNQTGVPVRGGDVPPCRPTDDQWFDMYYQLYGFSPPGGTNPCVPNPYNPYPNNPPVGTCPIGYKPDRCNCRCIPVDSVEIQSVCPDAERCPYPQFYPDPVQPPDGTGGWENCGINPHAKPCCLPPTNDPECRTCAERFGTSCGRECDNGTNLTDPDCIACRACLPSATPCVSGYMWNGTTCVRPPVPTPPPPKPSGCIHVGSNVTVCPGCIRVGSIKIGCGSGISIPSICRQNSKRCKDKFYGKCNTECKNGPSSKCKDCLCTCYGSRSHYARSYHNRVKSTPGVGYAFKPEPPVGLLIQRAASGRVHLA